MEQDIVQVFTKFLLDNNAYSQFVTNLLERENKTLDEYIDNLKVPYYCNNKEEELINYAFAWGRTSEEFWYWSKLDYEWRKTLEINSNDS